jgi:hypothetical protein
VAPLKNTLLKRLVLCFIWLPFSCFLDSFRRSILAAVSRICCCFRYFPPLRPASSTTCALHSRQLLSISILPLSDLQYLFCTDTLQNRLLRSSTLFVTLCFEDAIPCVSFCFAKSVVAVTRALCFNLSWVYWWLIEVDAIVCRGSA